MLKQMLGDLGMMWALRKVLVVSQMLVGAMQVILWAA